MNNGVNNGGNDGGSEGVNDVQDTSSGGAASAGERTAAPATTRLDWRSRVAVATGTAVIRSLAATWRFRQLNYEPVGAFRAQRRAAIYAFWHAQMLPFLALHRNANAAVLVSVHRDGERITHAAARFGFRAIRGSTSRGAAGALRGLVRALQDGLEVVVTPDGPRGPARKIQEGIIYLAQVSGRPIVPISNFAHWKIHLRSWDRFQIPLPFAKCELYDNDPIFVPRNATEAEREQLRFRLEESMRVITPD